MSYNNNEFDETKLREFVEQEENNVQVSKMPINFSAESNSTSKPIENFNTKTNNKADQYSFGNQLGWQRIPIEDLPTKGMFYPLNTIISIRAATSAEVRHWSTIDETNPANLDDMINYIIERCVTIKFPNGFSTWKDLKEIDRFYLLLAVSEFTFVEGENKLQIKVGEGKLVEVKKDMIDFVNFDEKLMKYYDEQQRCFILKLKDGSSIPITIPCLGVTSWLKQYIQSKQQAQQSFDLSYLTYAPFLILDWRGLNDKTYEGKVVESYKWSNIMTSILSKTKDLFLDSINPRIKYTDEAGMEVSAPINFHGGIKSIFIISDPFDELA